MAEAHAGRLPPGHRGLWPPPPPRRGNPVFFPKWNIRLLRSDFTADWGWEVGGVHLTPVGLSGQGEATKGLLTHHLLTVSCPHLATTKFQSIFPSTPGRAFLSGREANLSQPSRLAGGSAQMTRGSISSPFPSFTHLPFIPSPGAPQCLCYNETASPPGNAWAGGQGQSHVMRSRGAQRRQGSPLGHCMGSTWEPGLYKG